MGRFLNQAAIVLRNIFRFEGGLQSLSNIDLVSDIQPVFDLGRQAGFARASEFGRSLGLVGIRLSMNHTEAGIKNAELVDVYRLQAAAFRVPEDQLWIWLLDVSASTTNVTNFVQGQFSVNDVDIEGTILSGGRGRLVFWGDEVTSGRFQAGGDFAVRDGAAPSVKVTLPMLMTPGMTIQAASESDGVVEFDFEVDIRIWVGPRFSLPPAL